MKIGIMARSISERGGVGVYTSNLVNLLVRMPTNHTWVLLYSDARDLGRFSELNHVIEEHLAAANKAIWDQVAVPRACARHKVDVLYHPKFTVPLFSPCPSIMTLHGTGWFTSPFFTALDVTYIRAMLPLYLRHSALVSSVSQLTTDYYTKKHRLPEGKIRTIYFGPAPNFKRITDAAELNRVRERYNLPQRFILHMTQYRNVPRKNTLGVINTYADIADRVPHSLVVVGTDCERLRGEHNIPDTGYGARIHFPGWVDQADLPAIYSQADMLFYPSFMEAFPIPITEAMACGTPIVTSNRNGLAELAGDAAVQVDPDDRAAMAAAVMRVLSDADLRSTLLRNAVNRSALFSWERCAALTLQLIEEAVQQRR